MAALLSPGAADERKRCGTDYCGVPLAKLIEIHEVEYIKAGFRLVKSEIRDQKAVFRVSYPVKESHYLFEMEIRFGRPAGGCFNGCGTQHTVKQPELYIPEGRNAYVRGFAAANDRALRGIRGRVKALAGDRKP